MTGTSAVHHKRASCRACGATGLRLRMFLALGPTALANAFLRSPDEHAGESTYPLDVYFCESCALMQVLDVIDPEVLFRDYIYVTGTSDTMAAHNREYARTIVDLLALGADDLVVEVASNDGSLLRCFQQRGVRTLGIEPATNIAAIARSSGIETVNEFLTPGLTPNLRAAHGPARVVIGNNVLAHVDDPQDFLRDSRSLLDERGLVVVEVPYVRELLDRLEYDTIYHEHLSYFSVGALMRLCDAVGLSIVRLDHVPVHGGSLRMYAGASEQYGSHAEAVVRWAAEERAAGLTDFERYERFADAVAHNRRELRRLLEQLARDGRSIAGYGAPAKGNTLLSYCGLDTRLLPYTVDKSTLKVGLHTPGMHIPVLPVTTLLERQPDYVLILAWNFADEIMSQQHEYRERGGRFIIPIPDPRVV